MSMQIDSVIKRARAYWFVDGFTEIAAGGMLIVLAGALLISRYASQMPFPSWFLSVTGEIIILKVISLLIVILILWWLKDNFTYPRTGFVRNRISVTQIFIIVRNVILFLLLPIIILFAASLFITSRGSILASMPVWFPIGLGLIWAAFIVLAGEWMGLLRFRLVGGITLLTGIAVGIWQSTMGLPNVPVNVEPTILQPPLLESIDRTLSSLGFILLIFGVVLLISGMVTFLRYRKENPTPYSEDV
jgi:hypothetical protein